MKLFKLRSISTKLFILVLIIPLLTAVVIIFTFVRIKDLQRLSLARIEHTMLEGHKVKVKALASSMAIAMGEALKDIEGRKEREAYVRRIIDPIRFFPNKTGYYFVYRRDGYRIALPTAPHLVGINSFTEDPPAPAQTREFIAKAEKGGGFSQWYWGKPGKKGTFLKQGYVAPITGTDLLLMTAVYVDDVEKEKAAIAATFDQAMKETTQQSVIAIVLVIFCVLVPFGIILRRGVINPIRKVAEVSKAVGGGNFTIDLHHSARDEVGELVRAFSEMVRQRRQAEEALHKYKYIVSSTSDLMSFVDRNYVYQAVNDAYLKFHKQKDYEKIIGHSIAELYGPKVFNEVIKDEIDKCLGGEEINYQAWFDYPDFGRRFVDVIYNPYIDEEGSISGVVVNVRDITDRKRAEDALKRYSDNLEELVKERTQELEEAQEELLRKERLAALGQLTAAVAHEIRNPLGTVQTSVFSIGDAIERNEMARVNRALKLAERNIRRCDGIITELLDFTRKKELKPEPMDIDIWFGNLLDEQEIPEGIEYKRDLRADLLIPIDREYLRRAIINIVTNAIQALQEEESQGNSLKIETVVTGDRLEIRFTDNGVGIPDDVMDKIFEPLFSTKSTGVGLGLSIVKDIMEEHGGGIEIQSEAGKGTSVVLWLPFESNIL